MPLSTADRLAAIEKYSGVLAEAARDHLAAPVEHCPGWTVADLVHHVSEVHWFWGTVAHDRPSEPPDEAGARERPADDELVETFTEGARRLVEILRGSDQSAACWTWFPGQQDVAFITRHQVQEAAVHAWDAVHAAGRTLAVDPVVAADSVDEFLTTSLAEEEDARSEELPAFGATLALRAVDTGDSWTVTDGTVPGSLTTSRGVLDGADVLEAPAADLLLWLYQRRDLDTGSVPDSTVGRFRALSSTD